MDEEMNDIWGSLLEGSYRKTLIMDNGQQKVVDTDSYCERPVLGKILVLPRRAFKIFETDKSWACISISDAYDYNAGVRPKIGEQNRVSLLSLGFDDVEFEKSNRVIISAEQIKEIWDFVAEVWNKVDLLVVHCNAGISRSPAVAKAISDKYQANWSDIYDQLYCPNSLVYRLMNEGAKRE